MYIPELLSADSSVYACYLCGDAVNPRGLAGAYGMCRSCYDAWHAERLRPTQQATQTLTHEQKMRNVAACVLTYTERANAAGKRSRQRYHGDTDAIAGAARQLAEMVNEYLNAAEAVPDDDDEPGLASVYCHEGRHAECHNPECDCSCHDEPF